MIGDSADRNPATTDVLDDSAGVGKAFRRQISIEVRKPIFGAENEMSEEGCESVAHQTTSNVEVVSGFEMSPLRGSIW